MILDVKYPPLTSYISLAAFLSVLTCRQSGLTWYYNNYVQLYTFFNGTHEDNNSGSIDGGIRFRDELFGIYSDQREFRYNYNPFLNNNIIQDYTLFFEPGEIVEKIKKIIDSNHYLILFVDLHYVKAAKTEIHVLHDIFLYGYDDHNFYIGYFKGKFIFTTISFENLRASYESNIMVPWWFERKEKMFVFNINDIKYDFNIDWLILLLKDYYYARNTLDAFEFHKNMTEINKKNNDMIFGINIYNYFLNYFDGIKKGLNEFKIPTLYLFLDHKKALYERNKYLIENGYLKDKSILEKSELVYKNINICLLMAIKYFSTNKPVILDRVLKIFMDTFEIEKNLIETMLSSL